MKSFRNTVVIVSGRDREFLETHPGKLKVGFIAGHGVWLRPLDEPWRVMISEQTEWREVILPIMERFALRIPGSFVEKKDFFLAWHYRQVEPDLALIRISELKEALYEFISSYQISIL
ncbi:MAG TPA: trehalose-phosphatase [Spirochaetales bacterium]|nr:trehalose-phosphatase [Spirochaetales bacterium]